MTWNRRTRSERQINNAGGMARRSLLGEKSGRQRGIVFSKGPSPAPSLSFSLRAPLRSASAASRPIGGGKREIASLRSLVSLGMTKRGGSGGAGGGGWRDGRSVSLCDRRAIPACRRGGRLESSMRGRYRRTRLPSDLTRRNSATLSLKGEGTRKEDTFLRRGARPCCHPDRESTAGGRPCCSAPRGTRSPSR